MKNIFYCLLLSIAFSACTTDKKQNDQTSVIPTPTGIEGLQNNNVASTNNQPVNNSNLIYNPAHGAAGHDCSIAVGALLNKKTPQPATVTTTTAPVAVANPVVVENKNVAKSGNLNPAHGQPGHDCAVAVGAPLSSNAKPAQAVPTTPQPATPTVETSKEAKTNLKINPAHGAAGHNCAIAVGAPLT